jgi:ferredoxin
MQVVVDRESCAATGGCVFQAPEVFELREDGLLYVLQDRPDESLRVKVQKAVDYCPTGAISIVED